MENLKARKKGHNNKHLLATTLALDYTKYIMYSNHLILMMTPCGGWYHSDLLTRRRPLRDIKWFIRGHVTS